MKPDRRVAVQVAKEKNPDKILKMLKQVYLYGFADGAEAEPLESDERFLRIKIGTDYVVQCPNCGEEIQIDLLDLLARNGE